MDDDSDSHSPAPNQANTNGLIFWDKVKGTIDVIVGENSDETLVIGNLPTGTLGMQVIDTTGLVLFDAFQTTSIIVSDSNVIGDFTDIQTAINSVAAKGGGEVFLRNGTYLLNADIIIPSNTTLIGETGGGVIIDFQNQAHQILIAGSIVDNTGTVSIVNNTQDVVGVGTTFDNAWIGDSILLRGRWFTISAVTDANNLTVDTPFDADDISGYAVTIATPINGVNLKTLTVQNSTHPDGAIYYRYTLNCGFDGITVLSSTIGVNFLNSNSNGILNFFVGFCGIGMQINEGAVWTIYNYEIYGSTGDNLSCTGLYNASNVNATISTAGGNNVTFSHCSSIGFYDFENTTAGLNGIELVGSDNIEIFAQTIRQAASDGIKLTSSCSNISIHNVSLTNNGVWGVNIASATSSRNIITSCMFDGNTTGSIQDNGTSTIKDNNQT